jgi:DNA-binding LytR/AlgR family response regulator
MVKVAICDDNIEYSNKLSEQLTKFAKNSNMEILIRKYTSGKNLLFEWDSPKEYAKILYLEVQLGEESGLAVAEELREKGFKGQIIFYTKSEEEILDAFDVEAFHYILKEHTTEAKSEKIFEKAVHKSANKMAEHLTFSCVGESRSIPIQDILYFTINNRVVTVTYERGKTFDFYTSLEKMMVILCDKGFSRINRGTIVNIAKIEKRTLANITMKDGKEFQYGRKMLKVARKEVEEFFEMVEV